MCDRATVKLNRRFTKLCSFYAHVTAKFLGRGNPKFTKIANGTMTELLTKRSIGARIRY